MYSFFDSNLFQTIIILIVGLFIFIMYKINLYDDKRKIAIILIMEIREIEKNLNKLSLEESKLSIYYSTPVLKENSWDKYKFNFVSDLDSDEYILLEKFYSNSTRIEEERLKIMKQITDGMQTKGNALHQAIVDVARQEPELTDEDFLIKAHKISKKVYLNTPGYEAGMPKELMRDLLQDKIMITTSTAGTKLKKIAKI